MTEYVYWALFMFLGYGIGWLIHGKNKDEVTKTPPFGTVTAGDTAPAVALETSFSWSGEGPAPFRVVNLDGSLLYEGDSGGNARRHIEVARAEQIEWRAYRDGKPWDHGPREA